MHRHPLPICEDDEVQPTEIHTLKGRDFYVYKIPKDSYIIRAETQWVKNIGTAPRSPFLVSVNRKVNVPRGHVEMTRDPSKFEDHGSGIAFFSYETVRNTGKKSIVQAISEGYGHVVTFKVQEDLHLLAIDTLKSRKWLVKQMRRKDRLDLVEIMGRHFEDVTKDGHKFGRNDSPDEDAKVAEFICSELGESYKLDGYGIHDGYGEGFRPELALCLTPDPKPERMIGPGGMVLKSTQYGRVKAKAVCIASIFHDSSKRKAETRREREEKIRAGREARSPPRGQSVIGRRLAFPEDESQTRRQSVVGRRLAFPDDGSPPRRSVALPYGSPPRGSVALPYGSPPRRSVALPYGSPPRRSVALPYGSPPRGSVALPYGSPPRGSVALPYGSPPRRSVALPYGSPPRGSYGSPPHVRRLSASRSPSRKRGPPGSLYSPRRPAPKTSD